ncbi:hypothetical protein AMAG_04906 [Allomyces macrogynus ATCC 38327]|uniref:C3H1-type domain-containing protein n=1 Tax=Allomyces macrogynus (strain ATCC 38327) TaxID=578462 RepID=A0A0L0S6S6_ALLM3|nr:hypothetical protein, variant [Allomyces macrogynus ATCC 38327]KNE58087.1 hypothetical protein AMAG_04906 [Allomyces macrogynus ATCC 38327]|eukprot:KNE58086.1 hypothetical protein, variant [Allomyces macrogynus ATCC 38327]
MSALHSTRPSALGCLFYTKSALSSDLVYLLLAAQGPVPPPPSSVVPRRRAGFDAPPHPRAVSEAAKRWAPSFAQMDDHHASVTDAVMDLARELQLPADACHIDPGFHYDIGFGGSGHLQYVLVRVDLPASATNQNHILDPTNTLLAAPRHAFYRARAVHSWVAFDACATLAEAGVTVRPAKGLSSVLRRALEYLVKSGNVPDTPTRPPGLTLHRAAPPMSPMSNCDDSLTLTAPGSPASTVGPPSTPFMNTFVPPHGGMPSPTAPLFVLQPIGLGLVGPNPHAHFAAFAMQPVPAFPVALVPGGLMPPPPPHATVISPTQLPSSPAGAPPGFPFSAAPTPPVPHVPAPPPPASMPFDQRARRTSAPSAFSPTSTTPRTASHSPASLRGSLPHYRRVSAPAAAPPTSITVDSALYKTRLCERFAMQHGQCPYGAQCTFAHGEGDLRGGLARAAAEVAARAAANPRVRTRLCDKYVRDGFCQFGPRCNFAHGVHELRCVGEEAGRADSAVASPVVGTVMGGEAVGGAEKVVQGVADRVAAVLDDGAVADVSQVAKALGTIEAPPSEILDAVLTWFLTRAGSGRARRSLVQLLCACVEDGALPASSVLAWHREQRRSRASGHDDSWRQLDEVAAWVQVVAAVEDAVPARVAASPSKHASASVSASAPGVAAGHAAREPATGVAPSP